MATIALKLYKKSAGDIIFTARNINKKMKANAALFATPPVDAKTLETHIADLEDAHSDTINGGQHETEIRDEKRAVVEGDLKLLSLYVSQVSLGNASIIRKAGMPIKRQQSASINTIEAPKYLTVTSTVAGHANLVWEKVNGSRNYMVEYCDNNTNPVWNMATFTSRAKATVKNLQNAKEYWFRVCAIGPNSLQSPWTQTSKVSVQ